MSVRWIMHKTDGKTVKSGWDTEVSFRDNWSKNITSLQLQNDSKDLYTLSVGKGCKIPLFWQEDDYLLDISKDFTNMLCRKVFKSVGKDIWIVLSLGINDNNINFEIINRKIGI